MQSLAQLPQDDNIYMTSSNIIDNDIRPSDRQRLIINFKCMNFDCDINVIVKIDAMFARRLKQQTIKENIPSGFPKTSFALSCRFSCEWKQSYRLYISSCNSSVSFSGIVWLLDILLMSLNAQNDSCVEFQYIMPEVVGSATCKIKAYYTFSSKINCISLSPSFKCRLPLMGLSFILQHYHN